MRRCSKLVNARGIADPSLNCYNFVYRLCTLWQLCQNGYDDTSRNFSYNTRIILSSVLWKKVIRNCKWNTVSHSFDIWTVTRRFFVSAISIMTVWWFFSIFFEISESLMQQQIQNTIKYDGSFSKLGPSKIHCIICHSYNLKL